MIFLIIAKLIIYYIQQEKSSGLMFQWQLTFHLSPWHFDNRFAAAIYFVIILDSVGKSIFPVQVPLLLLFVNLYYYYYVVVVVFQRVYYNFYSFFYLYTKLGRLAAYIYFIFAECGCASGE